LPALAALAIVANAVLLLPYARALWWLHVHTGVPARLVLPVAGVAASALVPSFGAPRTFGPHEGIDVDAPAGTPVVAAADGVVIGNRVTLIGGNVVWIMGAGRRLYYYAHLRELAPGMHMGRRVAAGEQLGTVGNSGNAAATLPHLHFAVYAVSSRFYPLRYAALDPYPLLANGAR
jgi:murein DD-endopeptidase MepM/ murein hydrolase activator NlpD